MCSLYEMHKLNV